MVGQPLSNTDCGDLVVNLPEHLSLQSYLQRTLDETMDWSQLTIVHSHAAFRLIVSIQILNDSGNLRDACMLASVSALQDTKIPTNTLWQSGKVWLKVVDGNDKPKMLSIKVLPVALSMGTWKDSSGYNHWIVDPAVEEEAQLSNALTIVINANDSSHVLSIDLSGEEGISKTDLAFAAHLAKGRAEEIKSILS